MANTLIITLLIANLVFSLYLFSKMQKSEAPIKAGNDEYYVYIGLNDSTEGKQLVTDEEAIEYIDSISREYCQGYTISSEQGRWFDEEKVYYENCLICHYDNIPESDIYSLSDKIIKKFNQACVFIKHDKIKSEYYYGNK